MQCDKNFIENKIKHYLTNNCAEIAKYQLNKILVTILLFDFLRLVWRFAYHTVILDRQG